MHHLGKSIKFAMYGLAHVWRHEPNFRYQIIVSACVVAAGMFFQVRRAEFIVLLLLIVLVLLLEVLNSALEKFVDVLKPRLSVQVGVVKDMMAAMVFLAAGGAVCIGLIIFVPYIIEYILSS